MTEHEQMAAKYANTAFAILYQLPSRDRELTPEELEVQAQKQRAKEATERQRAKIKDKNARYKAKLRAGLT